MNTQIILENAVANYKAGKEAVFQVNRETYNPLNKLIDQGLITIRPFGIGQVTVSPTTKGLNQLQNP